MPDVFAEAKALETAQKANRLPVLGIMLDTSI